MSGFCGGFRTYTYKAACRACAGPSALLRLQSDERLIALTRRGNHAAFEVLCSRYQTRLLAFCRHMLSSREDAEDVLQEVFAAAYNAVLADEREINVRPWLYRIARNRSLNHLRRDRPIGVDTMDVHFADSGLTTTDKVMRRENFRELIADVQELPETQRTALLLREIDALSYEQIAHAMETTVPSVKSLLVRARISLAEAAEARKLSCEEVRLELGRGRRGPGQAQHAGARRHVRGCERCRTFRKHLRDNNSALAAIMPVAPLFLLKKLLLAKLGSTASAGGAHVAGGAGARIGAGAAPRRRRCGSRRRRRRRAGRRRGDRRRRRDRHQGRRRTRRRRDRDGRRGRRRPRLRHAPRHPRLALAAHSPRAARGDAAIVVHQQAQPASAERAPPPRAHRRRGRDVAPERRAASATAAKTSEAADRRPTTATGGSAPGARTPPRAGHQRSDRGHHRDHPAAGRRPPPSPTPATTQPPRR